MLSFFLEGFIKQSALNKGQRSDKIGAKPRSMVSSKPENKPNPLPTAEPVTSDNDIAVPIVRFKKLAAKVKP